MAVAPSLAELPETLPVFPLVGVLLLPRGRLPLNIFEPRYVAMIEDALAAPGRLIGMIQPSGAPEAGGAPAIYPVGCAGRIVSFSESDDPRYRYLITLAGVSRFSVAAEIEGRNGYRRVRADWTPWQTDLAAPEAFAGVTRDQLLAALKAYFTVNDISADWNAIGETPDERLITTLAMVCPFSASEKQALLEARDTRARAEAVMALMAMAAPDGGDDADRTRH